jgi:hypothetical protein
MTPRPERLAHRRRAGPGEVPRPALTSLPSARYRLLVVGQGGVADLPTGPVPL